MTCSQSKTRSPESIDIPALKAKYIRERERRMHPEGQKQYLRPIGQLAANHVIDPHMAVVPRDPVSEEIDVAIVGAGWGGIMAAYHLTQAGVTKFWNIDHAGDFGGVWYWNRYPGIQCDNDAYCYLPLLEETGYIPLKKFSDGWEIQSYSRLIAEKFGFHDKALFHTLITGLRWNEKIKRWQVETNRGDEIRARFIVMASGVLNMPKLPGVAGIETFKGKTFHTSRWDYEYTGGEWKKPVLDKMGDKRVAIVGTARRSAP